MAKRKSRPKARKSVPRPTPDKRLQKRLTSIEKELRNIERTQKQTQRDIAKEMKEDMSLGKTMKTVASAVAESKELSEYLQPYVGPIYNITTNDIVQMVIGAIIGVGVQLAFVDALFFAQRMSNANAAAMLVFGILLGFLIIYYSGIRKVHLNTWAGFVPTRLVAVYIISLAITWLYLIFLGAVVPETPIDLVYRYMVVVSLPAVVLAALFDLIS